MFNTYITQAHNQKYSIGSITNQAKTIPKNGHKGWKHQKGKDGKKKKRKKGLDIAGVQL